MLGALQRAETVVLAALNRKRLGPMTVQARAVVGANNEASGMVWSSRIPELERGTNLVSRRSAFPAVGFIAGVEGGRPLQSTACENAHRAQHGYNSNFHVRFVIPASAGANGAPNSCSAR